MAAGRIDVGRREDVHYSKKESYYYRNGIQGLGSSRGHHQSIRNRNGYSCYSGATGTDGGRNGRGFPRKKDLELGELSGRGRSNDAVASRYSTGKNETTESEDGVSMPSEKKRKISPIVWYRNDTKVRISSKNRPFPKITPLFSPPSLQESFGKLTNVAASGNFTMYPAATKFPRMHLLPVNSHVVDGSVGNGESGDLPNSPSLLSLGQCEKNNQTLGLVDRQYSGSQCISTSRWADEEYSPGEICSDNTGDTSIWRRVENQVDSLNTPESGEFRRGGSEGSWRNLSVSDGQPRLTKHASRGDYSETQVDNDDFMEIDENHEEVSGASYFDSELEDDEDSSRFQEPSSPKSRSTNVLQGCSTVSKYEMLSKINEGAYGIVYKARDKQTRAIVALKKVKLGLERDGFPLSSLREINILLSLHHPSVIVVKEVVVDEEDDVFMVMEYMEHDLRGLTEMMKQPFSEKEVKCLMRQLLEGVRYLHDNWVIHRDLKTSNILLNNSGKLKICDFGLSRQYGSPLKPYTPLVVTLWYRAPELLLGMKQYSMAIDMWSVGCIMAELLAKQPLFNGKTEIEHLDKIFRILGTPSEKMWPGFSNLPGAKVKFVKHLRNTLREKFPAISFKGSPVLSELGFDLLSQLLTYDPEKRITAEAALKHRWFHVDFEQDVLVQESLAKRLNLMYD